MKKYIFNLLLLFCCTCSVYAQNSSVEVQTNRIEVEGCWHAAHSVARPHWYKQTE